MEDLWTFADGEAIPVSSSSEGSDQEETRSRKKRRKIVPKIEASPIQVLSDDGEPDVKCVDDILAEVDSSRLKGCRTQRANLLDDSLLELRPLRPKVQYRRDPELQKRIEELEKFKRQLAQVDKPAVEEHSEDAGEASVGGSAYSSLDRGGEAGEEADSHRKAHERVTPAASRPPDPDRPTPPAAKILVKLRTKHKTEVKMQIVSACAFGKMFDKFRNHALSKGWVNDTDVLVFEFDGENLQREQTPLQLDMENDYVVDVRW